MTILNFNFRLESQWIAHQNLLLGNSSHNLVALIACVLAALTTTLRATEPIVLKTLTVKLKAARARTVAMFGERINI